MTETVEYRQARAEDLLGIGEVFLSAFPESVRHYIGHPIPTAVFADIFAICLDAEPAALCVACRGPRVAGYSFAPAEFSGLVRTAISHGHLWRIAVRWLRGKYGFGIHPVFIAAHNWVSLLRDAREEQFASEARIFSIAVHADYQGYGIGTGLLRMGLDYLASRHVPRVRLEVRPQNAPAVHLYEKFGFVTVGRTHDTQGEWLIMLKKMDGG